MGDRGNIAVIQHVNAKQESEQVWFYDHWTGTDLPDVLKSALRRQVCWGDETYLARIIFCEMVKGQEAEAFGFGISTSIGDNEHDILVCDVPGQRVYTITEYELKDGRVPDGWQPTESWSFAEFVARKPVKV